MVLVKDMIILDIAEKLIRRIIDQNNHKSAILLYNFNQF